MPDMVQMKVEQWAEAAVNELDTTDGRAYESVHLDDLLSAHYAKASVLQYVHASVRVLARMAVSSGYSFRVAVPLQGAERLTTHAPRLESLYHEIHLMEPPSLYVCRNILAMYVPYFEEYRVPLKKAASEVAGATLSYYSCFRLPGYAYRNEEYSRVVWYDVMSPASGRLYQNVMK